MKKNLIYSLLVLVTIVACKKIEPAVDPSEANDPIYLLEGNMNGTPLNLYVNDTTVFIDNTPSTINGIEAYSSTIYDTESGFELKLTVLKPEIFIDEQGIQLIDQAETKFLVNQPICKQFNFQGTNQSDYTKIEINKQIFNGNTVELLEYGKYNVAFSFNNINSNKYTFPVEFGFKDEILNPNFTVSSLNNFVIINSNNNSVSHKWYVDGNKISELISDTITLTNGIHTIKHSVVDSYDNFAEYSTIVNIQLNELIWSITQDYCNTNFIENNYGRVIIESVFEGENYTSAYNPVNLTKNLLISNVEYFINGNSQTINFIKFNINFDAELKNADQSKTLNLTDMEGTFHIKIN